MQYVAIIKEWGNMLTRVENLEADNLLDAWQEATGLVYDHGQASVVAVREKNNDSD